VWLIIGTVVVLGIIGAATSDEKGDDELETAAATTEGTDTTTPATSSSVPSTSEAATTAAPATTEAPATTAAATQPPATPPPPTTPPPTPPPTTQPAVPGFGEGIQLVGTDVQPDLYIADSFGGLCYWERLSGVSGELDDLIVNDLPNERALVEIVASDYAFNSEDCGDWTLYVPGEMVTSFGDGDWAVGQDFAPGQYSSEGGDGCYWERASGFTHGFEELTVNDLPSGRAIVQIDASDVRFTSKDCGTWTPL
jgi:hypothetical protein